MATGKKAFSGKSQASLIGAIMHSEPPPISSAPADDPAWRTWQGPDVPLAKDADERFQTAYDVRLQLQWIVEGGSAAGLSALWSHPRGCERLPGLGRRGCDRRRVLASVAYLAALRKSSAPSASEVAILEGVLIIDFLESHSIRISAFERVLIPPAICASGCAC